VPQGSPIESLVVVDRLRERVGPTLASVLKLCALHVVDREDEIVSSQLFLAFKEPLQLLTACSAAEKGGRYDGNEERCRIYRSFDTRLPLLPPSDVLAVLKDRPLPICRSTSLLS
jgi:hypothetical protein